MLHEKFPLNIKIKKMNGKNSFSFFSANCQKKAGKIAPGQSVPVKINSASLITAKKKNSKNKKFKYLNTNEKRDKS